MVLVVQWCTATTKYLNISWCAWCSLIYVLLYHGVHLYGRYSWILREIIVAGTGITFAWLFDMHTTIPLRTGNPKTGTIANSEDPDEMPHNAAFHQGLHCLLRQRHTK